MRQCALVSQAYFYFRVARARTVNMSVQLAVISETVNRVAWGEDLSTASAVIAYMAQNTVGLANAMSAREIADGAMAWDGVNGVCPISQGCDIRKVASVLHKLSQGVAHAAVRRVGGAMGFYVHSDSYRRLLDERAEADALETTQQQPQQGQQAAAPRPRLKPCITQGCPYAGGWEPPLLQEGGLRPCGHHQEFGSTTEFPEGPKCCGSCTGHRHDGRPMEVAHGSRCERTPWLGQPNIDTAVSTWLGMLVPSQLNDVLNQAYGTARLVQSDLDGRLEGVTIHWSCPTKWVDGMAVIQCQLEVTKGEGLGQWVITMPGPNRAIAKLRAQISFLHCYKVLLNAAQLGRPVDYIATWLTAAEGLAAAAETSATVAAAASALAANAVDLWTPVSVPLTHGVAASGTGNAAVPAAVAGAAVPAGRPDSLEQAQVQQLHAIQHQPPQPQAPAAAAGAAVAGAAAAPAAASGSADIWGATATRPVMANRAMYAGGVPAGFCAVARHETYVYALPNRATQPATKIVPVSALRVALGRDNRTRNPRANNYTDDQLLDGFLAESNAADTAGHGNVPRFGRTVLDPLTMSPVNADSRAAMQIPSEPCLVVRLKNQRRGRGNRD